MNPGVLLVPLAGAALVAYAGYRYLLGILVRNLVRNPEMHLDFSAREGVEEPRPGAQRPDAPLVLFLHEYAADGSSYRKYAGFLEDRGYRIRAPDLPQGEGEGPRMFLQESDVAALVPHLEAARAEAGEAPLVVFGVSRGANAGVELLGRTGGGGVAALVTDGFFSTPDVVAEMIRKFAPIYIGRTLAGLLPGGFVDFTARRGLEAAGAALGTRFPAAGARLPDLGCPVLLLHGKRDRNVPAHLVPGYAGRAPAGSRSRVFPKARHNEACLVDPEGYRAEVLGFLEENGAGYEPAAEVTASSAVSAASREKR